MVQSSPGTVWAWMLPWNQMANACLTVQCHFSSVHPRCGSCAALCCWLALCGYSGAPKCWLLPPCGGAAWGHLFSQNVGLSWAGNAAIFLPAFECLDLVWPCHGVASGVGTSCKLLLLDTLQFLAAGSEGVERIWVALRWCSRCMVALHASAYHTSCKWNW